MRLRLWAKGFDAVLTSNISALPYRGKFKSTVCHIAYLLVFPWIFLNYAALYLWLRLRDRVIIFCLFFVLFEKPSWNDNLFYSKQNNVKYFRIRIVHLRRSWFTYNPNPYCFKAISKLTTSGWKEPLLTYPHTARSGERGRCAFSAALKICLIEMWITLTLLSKA
jgi:hypothetical protein